MINLSLSLLKHSDIREEIKKYLEEKYNITYSKGSNFNYIVEFLSILNTMMSYQLTNVAKNLTLSAVDDRDIGVDLAQKLGYSPKLKIPSAMTGNLKVTASSALSSLNLTNITFTGNDKGYVYITDDISITDPTEYLTGLNTYEIPFTAYQMEARKITTKISESEPYVYIDSEKIAEKEIVVSVNGLTWTSFDSFDNVPDSDDTIFFKNQDTEKGGRLYIRFGNGLIGLEPGTSDDIEVTYYITEGADGNGETELTITNIDVSSTPGGLTKDDFNITDISFSFGGKDYESLEDIKINAPRHYNTKNRLVSRTDYESMLNKLTDNDIKYFSIIDMYDRENLEYFYKLGNIYLSMVPSSIYSEELTTNNMYTKNQTLALEDIYNLNMPSGNGISNGLSDYENNFIISTNRVLVSPSYLYADIQPRLELFNKSYSIGVVGNDLFPILKDYSITNEGLSKYFRSDDVISLIMEDDRIKSVDLSINYSLLTNKTNIIGTKKLSVPSNIVTTNKNASVVDNLYLNYKYDYAKMPDNRKALYGILKSSITDGFGRYIITDNMYNSSNTSLATNLYINPIIVDETETTAEYIDYSDYSFDAQEISLGDGSIAELVIKTLTDLTDYVNNGNVPMYYVEGNDPYNLSYYDTLDDDVYFVYFKRGVEYYLLGVVNIETTDNNNDYICSINYAFGNSGPTSEIKKMFDNYSLVMVKNKPFLSIIDSTYNISSDTSLYNGTKISFYIINNSNVETSTEYIKLKSYKPIGTLAVDTNNHIKLLSPESGFSATRASHPTDVTKEILKIYIDDNLILDLERTLASGYIDLVNSIKYDYPSEDELYVKYKNQKFDIINNVLYCYEIIDDSVLGFFDRPNNKLVFNEFVYYNNTTNKLETFLTEHSIIDDTSIYQINLRSNFEITENKVNYIQDFDDVGGVCCLYNFRRSVKL